MTTTQLAHSDPRASAEGGSAPRRRRALAPLIFGGLLVGVGMGLLVGGLAWSLVAAAGLTAVGAGLVLRAARGPAAGGLAGRVSGLLVVTGAAAVAVGAVGGLRDGVREGNGWPWAGGDVWAADEDGVPATSTVAIDEAVSAVVVDLDRGTVVVRESDAAGVRLSVGEGGGRATHRVEGRTLHLDGDCGRTWLDLDHFDCRTDFRLDVPRATDLTVDQGAGLLEVVGVTGLVRADTGAGRIVVRDAGGDLDLTTGAGTIDGRGLTGEDVVVDAGAGEVSLAFADRPRDVRVRSGLGDVDVMVPAGAYRYDVRTGLGESEVRGLTLDLDADARISIDSGAGSSVLRAS